MQNPDRKTILIVDDVPTELTVLSNILSGEFRVRAVTDGPSALAIARSDDPPDLILLDIIMPGMDGFEVCRQLKADIAGSVIPVIFLTASAQDTAERDAFVAGAVDYLHKPVNPELVLARVRAHLTEKDLFMARSELKYRRLFETACDGILIIDTATELVIDANNAVATLTGLPLDVFFEVKVGNIPVLRNLFEPDGRLPLLRRTEGHRFPLVKLLNGSGQPVWVSCVCTPYESNHRKTMQVVLRDISDLVNAQNELASLGQRLTQYLATSPTVTYSMRISGGQATPEWVSDNLTRLLGYTTEEALHPDWWFDNLYPADRNTALSGVTQAVARGSYAHEYRFLRKDRSILWLRDELRVSGDDEPVLVGTLTDVSDRKAAEEEAAVRGRELEASLDEKMVLLREIHHRVKNNMQVISSLLMLSASGSRSAETRQVLVAITRRIKAMAIAHELFYNSDDFSHIDFASYLRDLVQSLFTEREDTSRDIALQFIPCQVLLSLEEAIPAGLIVSELVANSLGHAFSGSSGCAASGLVKVELACSGTMLRITVRDSGCGFSGTLEDGDAERQKSGEALGLVLVESLTDQLHGSLTYSVDSGTVATLEFPVTPLQPGRDDRSRGRER